MELSGVGGFCYCCNNRKLGGLVNSYIGSLVHIWLALIVSFRRWNSTLYLTHADMLCFVGRQLKLAISGMICKILVLFCKQEFSLILKLKSASVNKIYLIILINHPHLFSSVLKMARHQSGGREAPSFQPISQHQEISRLVNLKRYFAHSLKFEQDMTKD